MCPCRKQSTSLLPLQSNEGTLASHRLIDSKPRAWRSRQIVARLALRSFTPPKQVRMFAIENRKCLAPENLHISANPVCLGFVFLGRFLAVFELNTEKLCLPKLVPPIPCMCKERVIVVTNIIQQFRVFRDVSEPSSNRLFGNDGCCACDP